MLLHITNGDSAANVIKACGVSGEVLSWQDPMHHGPCPASASLDELSRIRIGYLSGDSTTPLAESHGFTVRDARLASFNDYDEVVLWFEHDLLDQLQLLQLLDWFAQHVTRSGVKLSLICIDHFDGIANFRGIGQLSTTQMASLFPQRLPATLQQVATAQQFWSAFCATDPTELMRLCASDAGASVMPDLPFLVPAIMRYLQEFPWTSDGLTLTERQLLQLASTGITGPTQLFLDNMDFETCLFIGDWRTYTHLAELCESASPLLRCDDNKMFEYPPTTDIEMKAFSEQRLVVTEYGQAVLHGETSAIDTLQRDSWLGGVHLKSVETLWCWDEAEQIVRQQN